MKKFKVLLGTDVPQYGSVYVEAFTEAEAVAKVEDDIFGYDEQVEEWEASWEGASDLRIVDIEEVK